VRVIEDQVGKKTRRRRLGAVVRIVVGGLLAFWASFWLVMGALLMITATSGQDFRGGFFVTLLIGVAPALLGGYLVERGVQRLRQGRRLRDLVAAIRRVPQPRLDDLQRELELGPMDAARQLLDGIEVGVVDDGPMAPAQDRPGVVTTMSGVHRRGWDTPAAHVDDLTGAVLNATYRVERHLRSGAMGAVYEARHTRTGQRVAIKTLLSGATLTERALRRFAREARAASALGHPGIVRVLDFDVSSDGTHFLVMELLEGETLEDRLARRGHLPWSDAIVIARQVGAALSVAHGAGVLHRDLKPANVFLASSPNRPERAVLLDFGLARKLEDGSASRLTHSGASVGTPAYMSPEQARGEELDARSDVHALGAILYEMLTGEPPFLDQTLAGVYAKLLTSSASAPSALAPEPIPAPLDGVLARALAKEPDQRFASVESLLRDMDRIVVTPPPDPIAAP
jgi:Protein kinase domain